jgi:hypothetical protein
MRWQGITNCIFCNILETIDHSFTHCSIAAYLWTWITRYNTFCEIIKDIWHLNTYIPYKDDNICEMIRGAVLWIIWNERNILIFREGNCKNIRTLGNQILALIKYWSQLNGQDCTDKLKFIVP